MKDIPHRELNEAFPPEVCIFNFQPCETYTSLSMERLFAYSVVLFFDYLCIRASTGESIEYESGGRKAAHDFCHMTSSASPPSQETASYASYPLLLHNTKTPKHASTALVACWYQ